MERSVKNWLGLGSADPGDLLAEVSGELVEEIGPGVDRHTRQTPVATETSATGRAVVPAGGCSATLSGTRVQPAPAAHQASVLRHGRYTYRAAFAGSASGRRCTA